MNDLNLFLPPISFNLREWEGQDFHKFNQSSNRLTKLTRRVGSNSHAFNKSSDKLVNTVVYSYNAMLKMISQNVDVRAFTFLLANNDEFFSRVKFNDELFDTLTSVQIGRAHV